MPYQHLCQNPACNKPFLTSHKRVRCCSLVCARAIQPLKSLAVRFWPRVRMCTHGEFCPYCHWEWTGGHHRLGYGVISMRTGGRGTVMVSRLVSHIMWELINARPIPNGLQINHHCDYPPCCSIWHLYIGTQAENMQDARTRDRFARGEDVSKMDTQTVLSIKELYRQGHTAHEIAIRLAIAQATVTFILQGKRWRHIAAALEPSERTALALKHRQEGNMYRRKNKLTPAQVVEIRTLAKKGYSPKLLSQTFAVSYDQVRKIILGQSWKHLP